LWNLNNNDYYYVLFARIIKENIIYFDGLKAIIITALVYGGSQSWLAISVEKSITDRSGGAVGN
jgi:hypothetical protein